MPTPPVSGHSCAAVLLPSTGCSPSPNSRHGAPEALNDLLKHLLLLLARCAEETKPVAGSSSVTSIQRRNVAEKLAPSVEKISQALTPEVRQGLLQHGLETAPQKIRNSMVEAMSSDNMPLEKLKKSTVFPVLAGYIGLGLLDPTERDHVLNLQKTLRSEWRAQNPDAAQGAEFKLYPVGEILERFWPKDAVEAANQLLTTLQQPK